MLPRTLPPTYQLEYSDRDAALIAGYLMRQRQGTIMALDTTDQMAQIAPPDIGNFGFEYYKNAEAYGRFLLWWLGYDVEKNGTAWGFRER